MYMNRKILNLAIPNIISNITIPLLGMVDLAIVGHLDSKVYIGAIAIGSMVFNLLYWSFAFLRMGASGLTAQAYGARNFEETTAILIRGLMVAFIGALAVLILQVPIEKAAFLLIDGSSEVESLAISYFYIRVWAAPATIAIYALTGWFIGMQNTKTPMVIAIVINILNVCLNIIFVYGFNLKSDGVAWGTLIAQYSGLFIALILLYKYYGKLFKHLNKQITFSRTGITKFFLVNRDIFIRTMSLLAVFTFFTSQSASIDDNTLAANSLLLQFLLFFSFFTDGFAYAAEALVGKFYGAKQFNLLKQAIKRVFVWGIGITLIFTLIYYFGNTLILNLLTNQVEVLATAQEYTFWIVLVPIVSVSSFIWDGIFIGITAAKQMRNSMLISVFGVFFPVWNLLNSTYHNHALWFAFILFLLSRGAVQTIMYSGIKRKRLTKRLS